LEEAKRQASKPVEHTPRSRDRKISIGSYLRDNNRDSEIAARNEMLQRKEALELKVQQMMNLVMRSGEGPPSAVEEDQKKGGRMMSMFSTQTTKQKRPGIKTDSKPGPGGVDTRKRTTTLAVDLPSRGQRSESIVVTMSQWRVGKRNSTFSPSGSKLSGKAKRMRPSLMKGKSLGTSVGLACIEEDEDGSEPDEEQEALHKAIMEARESQAAKRLETTAKRAMRKSILQEIFEADGSDELGRLQRAVHSARRRQKKLDQRIEQMTLVARLYKDDGLLDTVLAANAYAIAHSHYNNPIRQIEMTLEQYHEVQSVMRKMTESKQAEMAPVEERLQELESLVGSGGWSMYLSAIYVLLVTRPLVLCWYKQGYLQEKELCPQFDLSCMGNPLFSVDPARDLDTPRMESTSQEDLEGMDSLRNDSKSDWVSNSMFDDNSVRGRSGSILVVGSLWKSMSSRALPLASTGDALEKEEGTREKKRSILGGIGLSSTWGGTGRSSKMWRSLTKSKSRKKDQNVRPDSVLDNAELTPRSNKASIEQASNYGKGLLGSRTKTFKYRPSNSHTFNAMPSTPAQSAYSPEPRSSDSPVLYGKKRKKSLFKKASKKMSVLFSSSKRYYKSMLQFKRRSESC
ncbi:hypothetical protein CYMTET_54302, partial [Cymbomonas tetramitiformis]